MATTTITTPSSFEYQTEELNLPYVICEVVVGVVAVIGNGLVIIVFRRERRLRRRTNYYIVSLAAADLFVGLLGIPFALMSSIGLPQNLYACLFTISSLMVLCTVSIFSLVAVSIDRYWAILHPMAYSRNVRTRTALVIISVCWAAGLFIGFLPLMGWHKEAPPNGRCFFLGVMDYDYLVFLYVGTILTPAVLLAAFYAHIYRVVLKQIRQNVVMDTSGCGTNPTARNGTMLRTLGAAQKREVKATQNLAIIVLFFIICWLPLYTINCLLAFCRNCRIDSTLILLCIILSHANSAGNPILYAYHLRDFRAALRDYLCGTCSCGNAAKNPHIMATATMTTFNKPNCRQKQTNYYQTRRNLNTITTIQPNVKAVSTPELAMSIVDMTCPIDNNNSLRCVKSCCDLIN